MFKLKVNFYLLPVEPHIDLMALQDQIVRVGQRVNFTVPIGGSPMPKVLWTLNHKDVVSNDRIDVHTRPTEAILDIPFAARTDSGTYTLKLKNELGECSGSANVQVLGERLRWIKSLSVKYIDVRHTKCLLFFIWLADRPSPPKGPLQVFDVTKENARVAWKPPDDDGGSPVLHYIIEKMDTSRGTWSDAGMSPALNYLVERLIHKKEYYFRVRAVNAMGESDPLECDKGIIAQNEFG